MMAAKQLREGSPLGALLEGLADAATDGDLLITGLAIDSRMVMPGDLFLALCGQRHDGREFIDDAVRAGAGAVVYEAGAAPWPAAGAPVPVIACADLGGKAGIIADRFFGSPSAALDLVGITGTNGKTSVCHFLAGIMQGSGKAGLIGTVGYGLAGQLSPAPNTTPDPVTLHRILSDLRARGARYAGMEVSSHGLTQGRIAGVRFAAAVFTNLGRDHLDYHGDMDSYARAKLGLFEDPALPAVVVNLDDDFAESVIGAVHAGARVIGYTLHRRDALSDRVASLLTASNVTYSREGLSMDVGCDGESGHLRSPLIGAANASNLLAAIAAALALGVDLHDAVNRAARLAGVDGRMEACHGGPGSPLAVVDYAHTPDALEQALLSLRGICSGGLWCVFGCGGDRDRGKRPQMGAIAKRLADHVVLTDDNPRNEDPARIIEDIRAGMDDASGVGIEHDRRAAIAQAIGGAGPDDVVLIAGKGHETVQLVGTEKREMSDRDTVRHLFEAGGA